MRSDGGDLREIRRSKSIRFISDPCVLRIDLIPTRSAEPLFSLRFSTAIDDRCCAQTRGRLAQNCVQIDVWRCSKSQVIRPTKPVRRGRRTPLLWSATCSARKGCVMRRLGPRICGDSTAMWCCSLRQPSRARSSSTESLIDANDHPRSRGPRPSLLKLPPRFCAASENRRV